MISFRKAVLIFAILAVAIAGCSTESSEPPPRDSPPPYASIDRDTANTPPPAPDSEHSSVLGSTFHVIGAVILFPFKVVGEVLGLIF